jgi:hypothetical protein
LPKNEERLMFHRKPFFLLAILALAISYPARAGELPG